MTDRARKAIETKIEAAYGKIGEDDAVSVTRDLLAALAAAGIGTYDTRTHAIVPRRLTRRMALAIDVAPLADDGSLEEAWQPTWDAGIAAAEAEAQGGKNGS